MGIGEYIKRFQEFLKNVELHEKWVSDLAKENKNPTFTKALKQRVKERDNYQCQECGIKARQLRQMNSYLTVHHIDFNHHNCVIDNLITLCPLCHAKTNFAKTTWIKYYSERMEITEKKEKRNGRK